MVSVTGEMLLTAKGATLVSRLKVASTAPPPESCASGGSPPASGSAPRKLPSADPR